MIRVSVIIPVYNLENYLVKCLESCVTQTLHDIEIICINDGSTDQSLTVLRQFEATDPRVRVIDIPNGGVVHARETGIENARGACITFLDGDDYLPPYALEVLNNKITETNADIVNGTVVHVIRDQKKFFIRGNKVQNRDEFLHDCFRNQDFYMHARLFKRELFAQRTFVCPPDITHNEDSILLLSLTFPAEVIASCTAEEYYYIFRPSSVSGSFSDKQYVHVLKARKMVRDIFKEKGLQDRYRSELTFFLMIAVFDILRYGNAGILSPEDFKLMSLKNLRYGDTRKILKKHLSKSEYKWIYPACISPHLFTKTVSFLRTKKS